MNSNEKIIQILKERRELLGLSISEVARRMGIPKSTLSRYESLERQFPLQQISNIAKALGLSQEQILGFNNTVTVKVEKKAQEKYDLDNILSHQAAWQGNELSDFDKAIIKAQIQAYLDNKDKGK